MVDFNNESTITRPADEILKVLIIEKRVYLFDALEFMDKKEAEGVSVNIGMLRSRTKALYLYMRATFKRQCPNDYDRLKKLITSSKYSDLYEAHEIMDDFLDKMQLTKWDNKIKLGGNIVERNKMQGAPV